MYMCFVLVIYLVNLHLYVHENNATLWCNDSRVTVQHKKLPMKNRDRSLIFIGYTPGNPTQAKCYTFNCLKI